MRDYILNSTYLNKLWPTKGEEVSRSLLSLGWFKNTTNFHKTFLSLKSKKIVPTTHIFIRLSSEHKPQQLKTIENSEPSTVSCKLYSGLYCTVVFFLLTVLLFAADVTL